MRSYEIGVLCAIAVLVLILAASVSHTVGLISSRGGAFITISGLILIPLIGIICLARAKWPNVSWSKRTENIKRLIVDR